MSAAENKQDTILLKVEANRLTDGEFIKMHKKGCTNFGLDQNDSSIVAFSYYMFLSGILFMGKVQEDAMLMSELQNSLPPGSKSN